MISTANLGCGHGVSFSGVILAVLRLATCKQFSSKDNDLRAPGDHVYFEEEAVVVACGLSRRTRLVQSSEETSTFLPSSEQD
jgi:hypothetical protein